MSTLTGLLGGGGKPTRVTSYTSGSGSFTPLSTTTSWMRVTLVGGGEGGDGARQDAYFAGPSEVVPAASGTGGSGGGSATYWIKANAPSYDYVVGAGGTGGTANITAPNIPSSADANVYSGTAGGNTTFGSFFVSGGGTTPSTVGGVMTGLVSGVSAYGQTGPSPSVYTGGGQGLQAIPGGYRGSGQVFPAPTSSNVAGTGGLLPGFGLSPSPSLTPSVPPLSNGGTISPASPSALNLGGGGGGPSIYGIGGNGGSVQSPYSGPTISGSAGSGYGAGGGGGGLIASSASRLGTWTGGNGGNGSGGLIIIEEFTF